MDTVLPRPSHDGNSPRQAKVAAMRSSVSSFEGERVPTCRSSSGAAKSLSTHGLSLFVSEGECLSRLRGADTRGLEVPEIYSHTFPDQEELRTWLLENAPQGVPLVVTSDDHIQDASYYMDLTVSADATAVCGGDGAGGDGTGTAADIGFESFGIYVSNFGPPLFTISRIENGFGDWTPEESASSISCKLASRFVEYMHEKHGAVYVTQASVSLPYDGTVLARGGITWCNRFFDYV